jgi:transcriptional regulator with XRE-family HTH domain
MAAIQIRLRELRVAKGLTQVQLAELCGMPQSTISRIESGSTTGVDFETLERVAAALGVHPSELIIYGKIPFDHRGKTYIISDATADAEDVPEGVSVVWGIEGQGITFPSEAGETPGDIIKRAKRLLGTG